MTTAQASNESNAAPRVTVTREAVEYALKKRVQLGKPNAALRMGVKGGGCAGLTYVADFTEDPPRETDLVYDFHGLAVYVDPKSLKFIDGSVLEFQNTLMYQGFKFKNPHKDSTCGCGMTFSVKKGLKTV